MNPHQYFKEHPEHRDAVMKAFHAHHVAHFREHPNAHNFPSHLRSSACHWCARTREEVRWDDLPPECASRPADAAADIADTLAAEEAKAHALYARATLNVPAIVAKRGMSGATLAFLHATHGFDPETVAGIVDVPAAMMAEYHETMDGERKLSRSRIVREVIACAMNDEYLTNEMP